MDLISILFLILALVHFVPALAALAPSQLVQLYGVSTKDRTVMVLLQHRAILFGVIGGALAYAAFAPELQVFALIMAAISMIGFIVICVIHGQSQGALRRIFLVDVVALPVLVVLALLLMNN